MSLPLLLLAGGLAGREVLDESKRQRFAGAFRDAMGAGGTAPQQLAGPVDPDAVQDGGLLGTLSEPVQQAFARMLSGVAGQPGVAPAQLLSLAGGMVGQERGIGAGMETQARAQEFTEIMRMGDQDFTAWQNAAAREQAQLLQAGQHRQAWALEQYRQGMENMRAGARSPLSPGMTFYPGPPAGPGGQPLPIVGPQSGTEQYVKGITAVRGARNAVANVDALTESYLLGGRGREAFGHESGQQAAMFNKLVADMAKVRDLGTMQKSDIEYLESFLPNPGAFFDKLYTGDERLLGTMTRLRQQFAENYAMQREANPWTVGVSSDVGRDLPPEPTAESVAQKYSGRAPADVAARLRPLNPDGRERSGRIRGSDEAPYQAPARR